MTDDRRQSSNARGQHHPRAAALLALGGLLALITALGVWFAGRDDDGGSGPSAAQLARAAEGPKRSSQLSDSGEPLRTEPLPRPGTPRRIVIPAAGVDAPIQKVSATGPGGAIEVPPWQVAGWWAGGPRPGEPGKAVIIGHIDSKAGPAVFARVPQLKPGASVRVVDRKGDTHRYAVVGGKQVRKNRFPSDLVYGPAQRPMLILVTCGGPFLGQHYRDNIIVFARKA